MPVDSSNLEQLRAWDGNEGEYWADHAEYFDRSVAVYHERLLDLVAISEGHRVLDVGCGTGQTTRDAARAASAGSALGIDLSSRMFDHARRQAAKQGLNKVTFAQADAQIHPIDPGAYQTRRPARRDRHRLGMHAIHCADPDVTARIIACWSHNAANGWSGRQLPALFSRAGIHDPTVIAETFTTADPQRPTLAPFTTMADAAANAGAITHAETASWLAELADAGATGSFFWAVTIFAVGGVRHTPNGQTCAAEEEDQ